MDKYTSTTFVTMLPPDVQKSIRAALTTKMRSLGLSGAELKEAVNNAMGERLVNLSDGIDVRKYLDMANGKIVKANGSGNRYKITYNNYYSRFQSGELLTETTLKDNDSAIATGRKFLRQIMAEDSTAMRLNPTVQISRFNKSTKRYRKEYVILYEKGKIVSMTYDKWKQRF